MSSPRHVRASKQVERLFRTNNATLPLRLRSGHACRCNVGVIMDDRERKAIGLLAEELALTHLQSHGLKLIARNYRCKLGEIDLVMLDGADAGTGRSSLPSHQGLRRRGGVG